MTTIVLTGADSAFFEFARGTIRSVRDQTEGRSVHVGMFDLGCTDAQLEWASGHVDAVQQPKWHHAFPPSAKMPEHFRLLFARPYLRDYFPGYDTYLWLDADAWVQEWSAVELLIAGAAKRGLAIVPECSRGNCKRLGDVEGLFKATHQWYASHYDAGLARRMANWPTLNAGVFALSAKAPHWEPWAKYLASGLQKSCSNLADQLALNLAVREGGLRDRTEILGPLCNWMCHCGLPAWDRGRRRLVDPYLPHESLGILHLSGEKQWRPVVPWIDGADQSVSLLYGEQSAD